MSEVASYETTVQVPSLAQRTSLDRQVVDGEPRAALLMRALELVVEDHGGEISQTVVDCDGKQIPCLVGVRTRDFPNGVGINTRSDGTILFTYDTYRDNRGLGRTIAGEILANYNAIAIQLALRDMNMEVHAKELKTRQGRRLIQVEGRL